MIWNALTNFKEFLCFSITRTGFTQKWRLLCWYVTIQAYCWLLHFWKFCSMLDLASNFSSLLKFRRASSNKSLETLITLLYFMVQKRSVRRIKWITVWVLRCRLSDCQRFFYICGFVQRANFIERLVISWISPFALSSEQEIACQSDRTVLWSDPSPKEFTAMACWLTQVACTQ